MPETCWAVFKWRAINLRDWCIWLVDLFECMMMHGLTNPKVRWNIAHSSVPFSGRHNSGGMCWECLNLCCCDVSRHDSPLKSNRVLWSLTSCLARLMCFVSEVNVSVVTPVRPSVRPSVRPYGTARLLLGKFLWHF